MAKRYTCVLSCCRVDEYPALSPTSPRLIATQSLLSDDETTENKAYVSLPSSQPAQNYTLQTYKHPFYLLVLYSLLYSLCQIEGYFQHRLLTKPPTAQLLMSVILTSIIMLGWDRTPPSAAGLLCPLYNRINYALGSSLTDLALIPSSQFPPHPYLIFRPKVNIT